MKKLLTLAAAGLLGLSGATQAAAEEFLAVYGALSNATALEENATYYIYDASKIQVNDDGTKGNTLDAARRALRYADAANAVVKGNLSFSTTSSAFYAVANSDQYRWIAEKDGDKWKFKNVAFNQYINGSATLSETAATFTCTYDAVRDAWHVGNGDDFGTSNIDWDGLETGNMTTWDPDNGNQAHWYQFFKEETTGKIKPCELPFKTTATEDWSNNSANMIWQAVEVHGNANKSMWTHVDGADVTTKIVERPSYDGYDDTQLWAFIGTFADGFKIVNRAAGQGSYLTFATNDGTTAARMVSNAENTTWKVYPTAVYNGQSPESYACFKLVQGNSETEFLNHHSGPNKLQTWGSADEGSSNRFFAAAEPLIEYYDAHTAIFAGDADATTAYNNAKSDPYNVAYANALKAALPKGIYNTIKANGDAFVTTLGLTGTDAANTWATASTVESDNDKTFEAISRMTEAYNALVNSSASLSADVHIKLASNQEPGDFMLMRLNNHAYQVGRFGSDVNVNKTTWTLKPATDGFRLYNEYSGKYANFPSADNTAVAPIESENDAPIFVFDLYDAVTARYGVKCIAESGAHCYLHSNGSSNIVRWEKGANSSWYIHASDETTANNEATIGANDDVADARAQIGEIVVGTKVGQYTVTDAYQNALNQLNAITENSDNTAKHNAATAFRAANTGGAMTLNMPQAGHFYRFQGINDTPKYLTTTESNSILQMVADAAGNHVENVWYFDGSNLVAFSGSNNGKVLSVCTSGHYNTVLSGGASLMGTVVFEEATTTGKYLIKVTNTTETDRTRYIYNLFDGLNGGRDNPGNNTGFHWSISQVDWLPIPGSDQAYATLTTPVALNLRDKVTAYKATVNERGRVELSAIEGNVIPANTPVVLHFENGVDRNGATGLVYLQVSTGGTAIESNDLKGSYLAQAKDATKHYAVLNGLKFSALAADATNVPGFKSHLEVSDDNDHALTTTVIEDILNNGKVYTIKNEDTGNNRGYLIHDADQNYIWTSNRGGLSNEAADTKAPTDAHYHWTVVSDNDGKHYLYNLGAQKFAAAYAQPGSNHAPNAEFYWSFSDEPTAIDIQFIDWASSANIFQITGGQNSANTSRPAGMMVINGSTYPVAGISGVIPKDGNGFIFTEVANATAEGVPTANDINAIKEAMVAEYAAAKDNIANNWNEEVASNVGYFTGEGFSAYSEQINAVEESADAEAKHYAVVRAQIAAGDKINKFAADAVYNITNADGQYYRATLTKNEDNTYTTEAIADDNFLSTEIAYNWRAAVNEAGAVSLSHVFQTAAAAAPASRAAENLEDHVCYLVENATPAYDGFGKVTLGENMVVNAITRTDNPETTAIEELSLDSKACADVIYDLQGRRVSKAGHGVYIVNGKKVYVK